MHGKGISFIYAEYSSCYQSSLSCNYYTMTCGNIQQKSFLYPVADARLYSLLLCSYPLKQKTVYYSCYEKNNGQRNTAVQL